ncbi:hypothetical protein V8C42DRAFT_310653 [Trichoderma barbatum]
MYNKGRVDIDAMAYEGVKNNWIKDKIWNPKWELEPGETWLHEEPEEEEVEAPATSDDSDTQLSDTVDGGQQAYRPQNSGWGIFGWPPVPKVTNDRTDRSPTQASGGSEASDAGRRLFERTEPPSGHQVAVTHGTQDPEQTPWLSLRNTRSSQAETRGDQGSSAASKRQRLNTTEDLSPSGRSVSSPPRQSKRSRRSDEVEDEQPPKRSRHNTRHSVLSSHNASDTADTNKESHDSKADVTDGVMQVKTLLCDEMAASTSRRTRGKSVRTVPIPLRRSNRIADQRRKKSSPQARPK